MKKPVVIVIILCSLGGLLIIGWITARKTHLVDFYTISTTSNCPTLEPKQLVMASRTKMPDYEDFVFYKSSQGTTFTHRLIGKPGDVIEIKDAVVYRNGKKLDEPYIWNQYKLTKTQYESIRGYVDGRDDNYGNTDSTYITSLTDAEVIAYKLKVSKNITAKGIPDSTINAAYHSKTFNVDNFGPVTVPANCFFLMGDNRHDAVDSRYAGFIKQGDYISTKIGSN